MSAVFRTETTGIALKRTESGLAKADLDIPADWTETGVLWAINVHLHPRGVALAIDDQSGFISLHVTDGTEGMCFDPDTVDDKMQRFERLIDAMREVARGNG